MIFSSYQFIFIFLPPALLGYAAVGKLWGRSGQKLWLTGMSLVFYSQTDWRLFFLLAGTVLFNHFCVTLMCRFRRKQGASLIFLLISMAENLGLLFYFKYSNFFLRNVSRLIGTEFIAKSIVLPLGISFFSFQILAYVIDVYRQKHEPGSLLDFSLFVTFFPQLIVGPIMRYGAMAPQLAGAEPGRFDMRGVTEGMMLFAIGCAKKTIIADPLITHAQAFYASSAGADMLSAWSGVLAFTFAYYFDFSGYIDMALGLGRLFGIRLSQNFSSPYKATDFAEFWRRWNISVSRFFNDYVFNNIFGLGDRAGKLVFATMATFLVSGVWHGAGWNFIAWGVFNGALVSAANLMSLSRLKLPKPVGWLITFFFAVMARVLFDSGGLTQAAQVYRLLFDFRQLTGGSALPALTAYAAKNLQIIVLLAISACLCFFPPNSDELADSCRSRPAAAFLCGLGFAASLFFMGSVSSFLYFQF